MNFLSHLYLSGDSEGLLIGNFIADSVKGSAFLDFSPEVQKGILLHHKIDTFTDSHRIVEKSKERLRPKYRKYASVIVDIYYDHFLAANWQDYSDVSLDHYTQKVYGIINEQKHTYPQKSQLFTQYMLKYNILSAYAHLDGIDRVLKGMAGRATFESNMDLAVHDLKENYSSFEDEFRRFFPELQEYVNTEI